MASTARPARAEGTTTTPTTTTTTTTLPPTDEESPLITELRARSAANKEQHDAERLASYWKRNADALRAADTPALDPALRAKIKAWLDANT